MDLAGQRITVMGLGRHGGGVSAARWLARQGATVTVTDLATQEQLSASIAQLDGVPIAHWALGRHEPSDLLSADAIVVNPAVRPAEPLLAQARAAGVRVTSEIELFLERCPARVAGVTGSNGKSTTATMLTAMIAAEGGRVWLGGNIGTSLLENLNEIKPADSVVLELSSFQLFWLSDRARFPTAAVITACSPNHLDWHGSLPSYLAAKRRLVEQLPADGHAVYDTADPLLADWPRVCRARWHAPWPDDRLAEISAPGVHNRRNAALAAALAEAWGIGQNAIERGLRAFEPLPHRCQKVAEVAGRIFVDDSKSTSPQATSAAMASCSSPIWLLVGGQAKGADFDRLAIDIIQRASGVACFGIDGAKIQQAVRSVEPEFPTTLVKELNDALSWCWQRSRRGDTLLLSPACASLDQFRDFQERGQCFRILIDRLAAQQTAAFQASH